MNEKAKKMIANILCIFEGNKLIISTNLSLNSIILAR